MIELRLRDGFLEYRFRQPSFDDPVDAFPPEHWGWSEWIEVKEDGKRFRVGIFPVNEAA